MKQLFYLCLFLSFVFSSFTHDGNNAAEANYINHYNSIAVQEMYNSKIPASVILAQGMLESDLGRSVLASKANNHFGIKCKSWSGPTYFKFDDDRDQKGNLVKSCFRVYDNSDQSYKDHSSFLMNSDRYQGLFVYRSSDYKSWANGLQACGYATDKSYARKLIKTIEEHQLYIYDVDLH